MLDVRVVCGQAAQLGEDAEGLGGGRLGEVARRFVGEEHADEEDEGGKGLQGEGEDVLRVAVEALEGAVVDPEGELLGWGSKISSGEHVVGW